MSATCPAVGACHGFVERAGAVAGGESATDLLGTQGDLRDAHRDVLLAPTGWVVAQWVLARAHDRRLAELSVR